MTQRLEFIYCHNAAFNKKNSLNKTKLCFIESFIAVTTKTKRRTVCSYFMPLNFPSTKGIIYPSFTWMCDDGSTTLYL